MKNYSSPMLQVVGINKKDVIMTSIPVDNNSRNNVAGDAPGMRGLFDPDDSWANAGY